MHYEYYMEEALRLAGKALAKNDFPVGCVIVGNEKILARGIRRHSSGGKINETDHAEMNALRQLALNPAGAGNSRMTVFSTMEPCLMCYGALLIHGINDIVYAYEDVMGGATGMDLSRLSPLYRDQKVRIVPHILRRESLELFKAFFKNPGNSYWKGSLLSTYTLAQESEP
jgi:tRNA(adenine34) deaminase